MFGSSFTVLLLAGFAVSALALACGVCRDMGVRPLAALRRFAVKLSLPGMIAFGLVAAPLFKAGATNCSWTIADSAIVTNKCAFFGARGFLADDDSDADGVVAQREVAPFPKEVHRLGAPLHKF